MKRVMTSVLAACMALSMAACASKTDPSGSSASSDASSAATSAESSVSASESEKVNTNVEPKDIEAAIATKLGSDYLATVEVSADDLYLTPLADLDMSKIESYIVKQSETPSVDTDKVVIAKCKDASYADEVVKAFNADFQQTVHYIHQYPFGVAKVEGGKIYKADTIVIFVIGGKSASQDASADDEAKLAAEEYAKIDEAIKSVIGTVPENLATYDASSEGDSGEGGGDEIPDKPILGG